MSEIIVAKFGGTSLGSAEAIIRSAKITIDKNINVVVCSAVSGTTNHLVELKKAAKNSDNEKIESIISQIADTHFKILEKIDLENKGEFINEILTQLREVCGAINKDNFKKLSEEILASGELLSSAILKIALEKLDKSAELLDARNIIKTDDNYGAATPLILDIKAQADKELKPKLGGSVVVTQGFIGSTDNMTTTTLGRGGSDYSAALIAEALDASQLQIWTDVSGIATTDPRLVNSAQKVFSLTFQEAAELSTAGAKILHSRTITPARRSKIPIYVGNSFEPNEQGTTISSSTTKAPTVRAIAIKSNQTILRITSTDMAEQFGYLAKILAIFAKYKVNLDQISTSEITVAIAIDNQTLENEKLLEELGELGDIKLEHSTSAISIIGNNVNNTPGLAREIFESLESGGDKISVKMICQGASKHNFCFFVSDDDGEKMVKKLHSKFIESSDL